MQNNRFVNKSSLLLAEVPNDLKSASESTCLLFKNLLLDINHYIKNDIIENVDDLLKFIETNSEFVFQKVVNDINLMFQINIIEFKVEIEKFKNNKFEVSTLTLKN
ncbi:hypothetical protein [Mesoplasma florum]|uniref:hypothetical protein n=1 Tax=Mesoplasma florum TaxID=2151 RepID=UPI000BE3196A|nr:hypothetical protein [Mesoplasma florum]ATI74066.1 hypothetical protein CQZ70_02290 [Mesoplasma florum]